MDKVLVIGAGFMGGGITQVVAQAGYTVHLYDSKPEAIEATLKQISWSTEKLAGKAKSKIAPKQYRTGSAWSTTFPLLINASG